MSNETKPSPEQGKEVPTPAPVTTAAVPTLTFKIEEEQSRISSDGESEIELPSIFGKGCLLTMLLFKMGIFITVCAIGLQSNISGHEESAKQLEILGSRIRDTSIETTFVYLVTQINIVQRELEIEARTQFPSGDLDSMDYFALIGNFYAHFRSRRPQLYAVIASMTQLTETSLLSVSGDFLRFVKLEQSTLYPNGSLLNSTAIVTHYFNASNPAHRADSRVRVAATNGQGQVIGNVTQMSDVDSAATLELVFRVGNINLTHGDIKSALVIQPTEPYTSQWIFETGLYFSDASNVRYGVLQYTMSMEALSATFRTLALGYGVEARTWFMELSGLQISSSHGRISTADHQRIACVDVDDAVVRAVCRDLRARFGDPKDSQLNEYFRFGVSLPIIRGSVYFDDGGADYSSGEHWYTAQIYGQYLVLATVGKSALEGNVGANPTLSVTATIVLTVVALIVGLLLTCGVFATSTQRERAISRANRIAITLQTRNNQLQEARREADQSNEAKRTFMSYIFHEVRVPMNAVMLGIELLLSSTVKASRRYAGMADQSTPVANRKHPNRHQRMDSGQNHVKGAPRRVTIKTPITAADVVKLSSVAGVSSTFTDSTDNKPRPEDVHSAVGSSNTGSSTVLNAGLTLTPQPTPQPTPIGATDAQELPADTTKQKRNIPPSPSSSIVDADAAISSTSTITATAVTTVATVFSANALTPPKQERGLQQSSIRVLSAHSYSVPTVRKSPLLFTRVFEVDSSSTSSSLPFLPMDREDPTAVASLSFVQPLFHSAMMLNQSSSVASGTGTVSSLSSTSPSTSPNPSPQLVNRGLNRSVSQRLRGADSTSDDAGGGLSSGTEDNDGDESDRDNNELDWPEVEETLRTVKDQIDITRKILDDVLSMQKIEQGKFTIDNMVFNLREFVVRIHTLYKKEKEFTPTFQDTDKAETYGLDHRHTNRQTEIKSSESVAAVKAAPVSTPVPTTTISASIPTPILASIPASISATPNSSVRQSAAPVLRSTFPLLGEIRENSASASTSMDGHNLPPLFSQKEETDKERKSQVQFRVVLDPLLPAVLVGDRHRLQQVVCNFISNSFKFTPEGGTITFRVRLLSEVAEGFLIKMSVADTGCGISREDQKRLFQPYVQIKAGELQKAGGTGLGLSICQHIVKLHGGRIGVSSQEGKGSEFFFHIFSPRVTPMGSGRHQTADVHQDVVTNLMAHVRKIDVDAGAVFANDTPNADDDADQLLSFSTASGRTSPNRLAFSEPIPPRRLSKSAKGRKYGTMFSRMWGKHRSPTKSKNGLTNGSPSTLATEQTLNRTSKKSSSILSRFLFPSRRKSPITGNKSPATSTDIGQVVTTESSSTVTPPPALHRLPSAAAFNATSTLLAAAAPKTDTIETPEAETTHPTLSPTAVDAMVQLQQADGQLQAEWRVDMTAASDEVDAHQGAEAGLSSSDPEAEWLGVRFGEPSSPLPPEISEKKESPELSNDTHLKNPSIESPGPARVPSTSAISPSAGTLKKPRALLVEDSSPSALFMVRILKKNGWLCDVAANGKLALEHVQRRATPSVVKDSATPLSSEDMSLLSNEVGYDIILMDRNMPVMDGLTATRTLRAPPFRVRIPLIGLTGCALDSERSEFIAAGVDAVLTKPVSIDELNSLLRTQCPWVYPTSTPI